MPRGGKREKAGRKTTWESGVKFEETSPIRVPNHIKDKLLEIAHRLDAGENFDSVSNSDKDYLQEIESKLRLVELNNCKLLEQVENYRLDLETESKTLQAKINELEQQNCSLEDLLNKNQSPSSSYSSIFVDLIGNFVQKWRKQINGLRPIDMSTKTYQMLLDLQKIVSDEKSAIGKIINSDISITLPQNEIVTKSKLQDNKIVTESVNHTQLGLLDLKPISNVEILKSLTALELSKRFGKNVDFVKSKKNYYKTRIEEFTILLKESDPQNIAWRYSEEDKKYHPILENQDLRTGSD